MRIDEIKAQFAAGKYDKPTFLEMMFEKKHKVLFEYSSEIKNTGITEITISEEGVEFLTRDHGLRFFSPTADRGIAPIGMFNMGSYEKAEADMILSLIEPGYTVFDVGANVGWFSMMVAKNIADVSLFSFEPIPNTFNILNNNLSINGNQHIKTYNFGFYSENTALTFYYDSECSGKTSAANLAEVEVPEVTCMLKKMDDFVEKEHIGKIDFLKCDVEGAEYFVYQGGLNTLSQFKPIIFSEMLRKWAAKFNYHPNEIIEMLHSIGYLCFVIRDDKLLEFQHMDENTIETNFIFLHKEKHALKITERSALSE